MTTKCRFKTYIQSVIQCYNTEHYRYRRKHGAAETCFEPLQYYYARLTEPCLSMGVGEEGEGGHNKYCVTDPSVDYPCCHHLQTCTQEEVYLKAHVYQLTSVATKQSNSAMAVTSSVLIFQHVLFRFKLDQAVCNICLKVS